MYTMRNYLLKNVGYTERNYILTERRLLYN